MDHKPTSQISNYVFDPVKKALDACVKYPPSSSGNKRRVLSAAIAMFYNASPIQRLAWRGRIAEAEETGDWSAVFPPQPGQESTKAAAKMPRPDHYYPANRSSPKRGGRGKG